MRFKLKSFQGQIGEIHKVYLLRAALFLVIVLYALFMFGALTLGSDYSVHMVKNLYALSGLRFFIMLVFFLPLIALMSEAEIFISQKIGINHDGNY